MEQITQESGEIGKGRKKTGLYTHVNVRKLDYRTRLGKHVRALLDEFYQDLGGKQNVSIQVRILVEDAILPQLLALQSFTTYLAKAEFKGLLPEKISRYWIALTNSLRLNLISVGLERKEIEPVDLSGYIARKDKEKAAK